MYSPFFGFGKGSGKGKGGVGKAITNLEKLLAGAQDEVVEHLKKLIAKAP